eukprot:scaffold17_cov354-Pavlova_lutheri.AAC.37
MSRVRLDGSTSVRGESQRYEPEAGRPSVDEEVRDRSHHPLRGRERGGRHPALRRPSRDRGRKGSFFGYRGDPRHRPWRKSAARPPSVPPGWNPGRRAPPFQIPHDLPSCQFQPGSHRDHTLSLERGRAVVAQLVRAWC